MHGKITTNESQPLAREGPLSVESNGSENKR